MSDHVASLLAAVLAEVRGLRADLASANARGRLTGEAIELLRALLPAVADALGSEGFYARDLIAEDSPVAIVVRGRTAKSLGNLLRDAENVPLDGFVVVRAAPGGSPQLWSVRAVAGARV